MPAHALEPIKDVQPPEITNIPQGYPLCFDLETTALMAEEWSDPDAPVPPTCIRANPFVPFMVTVEHTHDTADGFRYWIFTATDPSGATLYGLLRRAPLKNLFGRAI